MVHPIQTLPHQRLLWSLAAAAPLVPFIDKLLRGQRFEVLKARRIAGIDTLLLRELDRGSFSIAREWTDWADPSLGLPPQRLEAGSLFELATLLAQLTIPKQKG